MRMGRNPLFSEMKVLLNFFQKIAVSKGSEATEVWVPDLHYSDKKTARLLTVREQERPIAVQLFGDEPEILAEAARKALAFQPDVIDINMGSQDRISYIHTSSLQMAGLYNRHFQLPESKPPV